MGRRPSKNSNLPTKMRARKRGSKIWYYYDTGGTPRKEIPLGSDYALAIKRWSELHVDASKVNPVITFRYVAEKYMQEVIPTKAPNTQRDNIKELDWLYKAFDNPPAPLDLIKPIHIRKYLDKRTAKVRANREKALFSHIWNYAREKGYTDMSNPCLGVKGHKEPGRKEIYIEDEIYDAVFRAGSQPLKDAMALAYLTGQRPSDVLKMRENDIVDNCIQIKQGKTNKRLRISIEGELNTLIQNILSRKAQYKVRCFNLIVDETGQPFTYSMLRGHFDKARDAAGIDKNQFQFRDIRAKAGTDKAESSDIWQAQKQLGHSDVKMTHQYVRNRKGDKTKPTK